MSTRSTHHPCGGHGRFAGILFGLFTASNLLAQIPQPLSVDDAVRIGLSKNYQVIAANAGVNAAYANYRSIGTLPPLTLGATHVQGTSTAPTLNGTSEDTFIDFSETFDISGQRRYQAASLNAQFSATRFTFQETLLSLEQQIRDGYWSLAAARAQTKIADVSLKEAQRVYDLTVTQEKAGASPHSDVVRSSIDVANANQTLLTARGAERTAVISLNTLLARDPSAPVELTIDLAEMDTLPPVPLPPLKDLVTKAIKNRPLLSSASAQIRAANYSLKQAEASRFPDFGIDYQRSTESSYESLLFTANFPLFDFGSIRESIKAARETRKQAEAQQIQTQKQIEQQVAQAYSDLEIATLSAADYKKSILDPSVTLLGMAQLGYKQGATGILAVIDAESTIRNARVGYINSLLAIYKADDEARAATGPAPLTDLKTR